MNRKVMTLIVLLTVLLVGTFFVIQPQSQPTDSPTSVQRPVEQTAPVSQSTQTFTEIPPSISLPPGTLETIRASSTGTLIGKIVLFDREGQKLTLVVEEVSGSGARVGETMTIPVSCYTGAPPPPGGPPYTCNEVTSAQKVKLWLPYAGPRAPITNIMLLKAQ